MKLLRYMICALVALGVVGGANNCAAAQQASDACKARLFAKVQEWETHLGDKLLDAEAREALDEVDNLVKSPANVDKRPKTVVVKINFPTLKVGWEKIKSVYSGATKKEGDKVELADCFERKLLGVGPLSFDLGVIIKIEKLVAGFFGQDMQAVPSNVPGMLGVTLDPKTKKVKSIDDLASPKAAKVWSNFRYATEEEYQRKLKENEANVVMCFNRAELFHADGKPINDQSEECHQDLKNYVDLVLHKIKHSFDHFNGNKAVRDHLWRICAEICKELDQEFGFSRMTQEELEQCMALDGVSTTPDEEPEALAAAEEVVVRARSKTARDNDVVSDDERGNPRPPRSEASRAAEANQSAD